MPELTDDDAQILDVVGVAGAPDGRQQIIPHALSQT